MSPLPATRVARNSVWATAPYVLGSVVGVVTVPILLSHLGITAFGIFVIVQTIIAYASLARMGIGAGFVQGYAVASQGEAPMTMGSVLGTGLAILATIGAAVLVALWLVSSQLASLFRVPSGLRGEFTALLLAAAVAFALGACQSPFAGLLAARERVDLTAKIDLLTILLGSVATIIVVLGGAALSDLGLVMIATNVIGISFLSVSCRRLPGAIKLRDVRFSRAALVFLWRYGAHAQVSLVAGLVNRSIDRVWLGMLAGPVLVARYDVADRAAYSLVFTVNEMAKALWPRFAALSSDEYGRPEARRLYGVATRVAAFLAAGLALFAVVAAPLLLHAWLGMVHPSSLWALRALAIGYGVSVSFTAASVAVRAQNVPRLAARLSAAFAVVNVSASLVGVLVAGVLGAAVASAASGVAYAVVLGVMVEHRILEERRWTGLRLAALAWLPSVLAAGVVAVGLALLTPPVNSMARPEAVIVLAGAAAVFAACTLGVAKATRSIPPPISRRLGSLWRRALHAVLRSGASA